jgi:uroporphyrinogen decarboxylase
MTPREIVLAQIAHRETVPVPCTLRFEDSVSARLDEHYGTDAWRSRLIPYLTQCGSVASLPKEQLDPTHHRDAFGTVWRTDELPPTVVEPGLKAPTFRGYDFPSADAFLDPSAKAEVRKRIEDSSHSFTVVSAGLCLWQGWYLRGFETTLMDCVAEEAFFEELLDRLTGLTLRMVEACRDLPADAVLMGDDWGDQRGVLIGPDRWRRFYKPRYARIFQAIHDQGKLAIMHCCGSAAAIMGDIVEIGLDVLESVQPEAAGMNPYGLKKAWGDRITFWGGLGSQSTIPFGSPDDIRREIRALRAGMGRGGGYILAPAKPIRSETPTRNAVAVFEEFVAGDAGG